LQSTNDVGFGTDDFVGAGIDTSGNGSEVYYFETTPAGVRYQAASENARYKPQWTSSARATADGWEAILIVPLPAMRLHSGVKQSWRMNFIRGVAGTAEHYSWAWDGLMTDAVGSAWPIFSDAQFWPDVQVETPSKTGVLRAKPHAEIFGLVSAYVVVDGKSFSGGELAAARFQDNAMGKIVGDVTGGAGWGFDYSSTYTLPSGRMRFRIPNCVRLRKDGTNEAAGIRPDLYVPLYLGETLEQPAGRVLNAVVSDLAAK
jgi:hypothetical protein